MNKSEVEAHYEILKTQSGFVAEFWRMTTDYDSYEKAYEAVERKFKFAFGRRRYKNYNSFRVVRDKR